MIKVLGYRVSQMTDNSHFYWDLLLKKKRSFSLVPWWLAPVVKASVTVRKKKNPKCQEPCCLINMDDI